MYTASINGLFAISSNEVNVCGMPCLVANSSARSCVREHTAASSKRSSCRPPAMTQSVMLLVPTTPNRIFFIIQVFSQSYDKLFVIQKIDCIFAPMKIVVSEEIKNACPQFAGIAIAATVKNTSYCEALWQKIDEFTVRYREMYTTDSIKDMVTIRATREAYKKCGKDPSRYRPSGEALCRRILRGIPLYQIDTLFDLINLVSIRYGYSIGGFDADKFEGDTLTLGIGKAGEPYEGIGRGELNIEGMPVYRDAIGGVGTPTSDNERTKLGLETTRLLTIINGYSGKEGLREAADYMVELIKEFASAENVELIEFE